MNQQDYDNYVALLDAELIPALGCTEPIAIAYAAARAAKELESAPTKLHVACSGNIIKNVKSVIVPNSGGLKGIETSAIIGAFAGNAAKDLEVLVDVTPAQLAQCQALIASSMCSVDVLKSPHTLHIIVTASNEQHSVSVEVVDSHLNVISIIKDEQVIFSKVAKNDSNAVKVDYTRINFDSIIEFAKTCKIEDVQKAIALQIKYNTKIAEEGMKNSYGACVGRTLIASDGSNVKTRAKAYAAAGSDARMNGCDLPVVINSGSGNQGIAVSLPVIEYAKELQVSEEELYRALVLANIIALYEKSYIGKLSAYCGAVCAASGAGAGITYLKSGSNQQIKDTVVNTLGTMSGLICDGAKSSCAAKIAASIETAIFGHEMAMCGCKLHGGDGIVKDNADKTIEMVGRLASMGMRGTDVEILSIMLNKTV